MSESYTRVSKAIVAAASHKYIRDRDIYIARKTEELVDAELNRRWFKAKDRVQARDRVEEEVRQLEVTGGFWAHKARALISLCALSVDDTVMLSVKDAAFVDGDAYSTSSPFRTGWSGGPR